MSEIQEKEKIITNSYTAFQKDVQKIEVDIFNAIMNFLKSNTDAKPTQQYLSKINRALKNFLKPTTFKEPVKVFLKNFDQVEDISKKILGKENDLDLKDYNLTIEKQLAIEEIVNGLLNEEMINANLHSPLRKMLYRYATTNITLKKAEDEFRTFITNDDNGAGFAERYVKPLAIESLSRFDGTINQRIATAYELDGFRIVGSLIVTSQPQCVQMIKEIGELGKFAVNGKYAMADLPEIIEILKARYPGVYKGLTVDNFFIYRNHYGCRHQFIPTRLLERDKLELSRRRSGRKDQPKDEDIVFKFGADKIFDEYANAKTVTPEAKRIMFKVDKPGSISRVSVENQSYFSPDGKRIAVLDKDGSEGFLHEYGHHIDFTADKKGDQISMGHDFIKARDKDYNHLENIFDGKDPFDELKRRWYGKPKYRGISDIFDSMTGGAFQDLYKMPGHGFEYYRYPQRKQAETFANLFEAYTRTEKSIIDEINRFFPNQLSTFTAYMDKLLNE